ncbi:MAG: phosphate signaling complex protein PhoU [Desulfuromonadales bacterium]
MLKQELERLEKHLLTLTAVVEENVQQAVKALATRDVELAQKVVIGDDQVNRMEVDIEEECLKVLALHQPVAHDLRLIVAVMKINNDLERIADNAVSISQRAISAASFSRQAKQDLALELMSEKALDMLGKALDSLVNADLDLARKIIALDEEVDILHAKNYDLFKEQIRRDPESVDFLLHFLVVSRNLERIADLATNIAEDVIYLNEGNIIRHKKSS